MTPLLWTAYVVLPAAGWGLFHGIPVGVFGAAVLFAVWWTWSFRGPLLGRSLLAGLLILKLLAGSALLLERGLAADYYANEGWAPPQEHSTEFRSREWTRIDRRLAFGEPGSPDLPLYFFNDHTRFNFYRPGDPDRGKLPFSATWRGYVWARDAEDRRTFYLHGKGVHAELWVDEAQTVGLDPASEEAVDRTRWPAGMRRLTVRVSSPYGGGREFEAGFMDARGKKTPFDESDVLPKPFARWRMVADRIIRVSSKVVDMVLLAMLFCSAAMTCFNACRACRRIRGAERRKAWLALAWLAAFLGGVLLAGSAVGRLTLLDGGSDYMTYETQARDIALHGPLMLLGGPSLYAYFLALDHVIFGEDLFGIFLIQVLLVWVTLLAVWRISDRLFGEKVGTVGLAVAAIFLYETVLPMARVLVGENLFIPLVSLWVLSMIGMAAPTANRKVSGGVALMLAIMVAVVTLATFWNWIVARQFDGLVVRNLANKALYALGFFGALGSGEDNRPGLIAMWSAALVGLSLLVWPGVGEGLRGPIRLLPALLSLAYLLVAIACFPHVYVDRLVLPLYVLLLPYAAVTVAFAADVVTERAKETGAAR